MITSVLYGITTLQTYFYFTYYPKDDQAIKTLVTGIWMLDTLHTGLVCHAMYHYLVSNYMNPSALAYGHWSLFVSIALNTLVAVLVQSFFAMRIFHLIKKPRLRYWVTSFIMLLVIAHFCFGLETVKKKRAKKVIRNHSDCRPTVCALCRSFRCRHCSSALCFTMGQPNGIPKNKHNSHDANGLCNKSVLVNFHRCCC